ncbi:hypothetical protein BYT27DRAFT_7333232 [Phlegmacium glaucopus]|nr:hypothetical protein BYT27DRAFT_7333232 [Phlegmacium glaucopus]
MATSYASPPTYIAPTQFKIGFEGTQEPLVNISQVKGHLALLHAFAELKKQVEGLQEAIPHMPADLERRWAWFVALAVERFDIWCHKLQLPDAEKGLEVTLPPLDVMMVWHAYMLNPIWYAEDCMRLPACQVLKDVGIDLAEALDGQLQSILSTPPFQARLDFWHTKTALPFDHVQSAHTLINKIIHCPQCGASIDVDMMTPQGSGYLQQKFSTSCSQGCGMPDITKGTLAIWKMAQDLATPGNFSLAGTLLHPSSQSAPTVGKVIKNEIRTNAPLFAPTSQPVQTSFADIIQYAEFSLPKSKARILASQVGASRRIAARILSAYNDDKAYSVELIGAVLRQGSFYKAHCTTYVGRFVDHDDKVEGLQLSSAFDETCQAWKDRFHVQYSHCGCPIPGDSIGQKLTRLINSFKLPSSSHLLPFNRTDLLSATHPSDHNAVHFQSKEERRKKHAREAYKHLVTQKKEEAMKAAEKAARKAAKAQGSSARGRTVSLPATLPPHAPRLETSSPGTPGTSKASLNAYPMPFLIPVPISYGWGCVAPDVYVINPSGSCGVGGLKPGVSGEGVQFDLQINPSAGSNCGGGGCGGGCGGCGGCGG